MNIIKPKKLKKGKTIGLLSVSGSVREKENIKRAEIYFQKLGYKTIISDTTYKKFRYHAGTDEERIKALQDFFENKEISGIICVRGGYGVIRILDKIDYDIIKNNPKILCGYSDITALLLKIYKETGLICFHGAMANGDFGKEKVSKFTEQSFWETLSGEEPLIYKATNSPKTINKGEAQGILWGGNLATITTMIGTDFIPNEKFILFVEDVNEPAYKIDRMFTQLFNTKEFRENVAGIAVGVFSDLDKKDFIDEMLKEYSKQYNIPCCTGFLISHEEDKYTLPVGVNCTFSSTEKIIKINDYPFSD